MSNREFILLTFFIFGLAGLAKLPFLIKGQPQYTSSTPTVEEKVSKQEAPSHMTFGTSRVLESNVTEPRPMKILKGPGQLDIGETGSINR